MLTNPTPPPPASQPTPATTAPSSSGTNSVNQGIPRAPMASQSSSGFTHDQEVIDLDSESESVADPVSEANPPSEAKPATSTSPVGPELGSGPGSEPGSGSGSTMRGTSPIGSPSMAREPSKLLSPELARATTGPSKVVVPPTSTPPITSTTITEIVPAESYNEVVKVSEPADRLDPLSHLGSIFDKIRKQVIEWGEDANWKIDVFLLPNEEAVSTNGGAVVPPPTPPPTHRPPPPPPHHLAGRPHGLPYTNPPGHHAPPPPLHHGPYSHQNPSPRHNPPHYGPPPHLAGPYAGPLAQTHRGSMAGPRRIMPERHGAPTEHGFELQPPPNDLPLASDDSNLSSLNDGDISALTETGAKKMLSMAARQLREQQLALNQTLRHLEAVQRHSAQRERDSMARFEAEKAIMEQDAAILMRKWKESSSSLAEKDNEVREIYLQLENGREQISKRILERRKRVDDQEYPLIRKSKQVEQSSRKDCDRPGHRHRHRHVHYHRHHHRHISISRRGDTFASGAHSLDNLATLATQVLFKEPLILAKKAHIPVKRQLDLMEEEDAALAEDIDPQEGSGDMDPDQMDWDGEVEKDEGLKLKSVVIEIDDSGSEEDRTGRGDSSKESKPSNSILTVHQQLYQQRPPTLAKLPPSSSTHLPASSGPVKGSSHNLNPASSSGSSRSPFVNEANQGFGRDSRQPNKQRRV